VETVWLITSLSSEQADAARLLELAVNTGVLRMALITVWTSAPEKTAAGCAIRWPRHAGHPPPRRAGRYRAGPPPAQGTGKHLSAFLEKMGRRINLVIRYLTGEVSRL